MAQLPAMSAQGHPLDLGAHAFSFLRESQTLLHNPPALRERMETDGYLFLRDYLDRTQVLDARREVLEKLASVGEIDLGRPLMEAIRAGEGRRRPVDAGVLARELRTGPALRALLQRGRMLDFFRAFLDGEPRAFDYLWLRTVRPGGGTGCHYDVVYMGRGTHRLYTAWTPLGDVPLTDGPLLILENSHRLEELKRTYGALDVDRDRDNNPYGGGWFSRNPVEVRERFGGRWLTADFRAGDVLIFTMFTLHCSADNASPVNRIRLSSDSRYQLASEPADERWIGDDPPAHDVERQQQAGMRHSAAPE